jgi:hypothetical protein
MSQWVDLAIQFQGTRCHGQWQTTQLLSGRHQCFQLHYHVRRFESPLEFPGSGSPLLNSLHFKNAHQHSHTCSTLSTDITSLEISDRYFQNGRHRWTRFKAQIQAYSRTLISGTALEGRKPISGRFPVRSDSFHGQNVTTFGGNILLAGALRVLVPLPLIEIRLCRQDLFKYSYNSCIVT